MKITAMDSYDVRFPTSKELDGSDAMNPDPDYSAAYVVLRGEGGEEGHGFCFTIGRGTEVCVAALNAYAPLVAGRDLDLGDLGEFARRLLHDSQLRWLGPEKGAVHMAAGAAGFTQIKLKVGSDLTEDLRRMRVARETVGPGIRIAIDANQRWDVAAAIDWVNAPRPYDPYWIEEPTSPDDILGHAAIRRAVSPVLVATGEHVHNRVMFKQLLQAGAIDVLQLDACRVAGVTENVAILLLAAAFGVPVCPHAGGVGLCEVVQHLAMFDYVAVSGSLENRSIEYIDHLHEHFTDPVRIAGGRYLAPAAPGFSAQLRPESLRAYEFPHGAVWQELAGTTNQ